MASSEGGMDIEEVAEHTPEKITRCSSTRQKGLTDAEARTIARKHRHAGRLIPQRA
jgi:succinyl-CoA synthetase beta subunit